MNTYLKKESGITIQENRFFDKLYSQHTLANNYEYTKYLKGYTEGFFVDVSGGVSQGKGYLRNSVYPVALYCLPPPHSLDSKGNEIPSITTDSIKAIREKNGIDSLNGSIYSPNWISQIYDDINIYSDKNIFVTDFLVHYNDKNDIFNNLGYSTTTSKDYYTNGQGIGSRVPLINVPALAYTDSSGKIYKVTVNETINLVDREIRMDVINKIKYSLNYLKRNSIQSLRNNTTSELETGSGHLVLSDNKLKLDSGIVNNVKNLLIQIIMIICIILILIA